MSKYFPDDCCNCVAKDVCQMNTFPEMVKTMLGRTECPHWQEDDKENKE